MVHYRECPDDERAEKTPLPAIVHYFLHRNILPANNHSTILPVAASSAMTIQSQGISHNDENADVYLDEVRQPLLFIKITCE